MNNLEVCVNLIYWRVFFDHTFDLLNQNSLDCIRFCNLSIIPYLSCFLTIRYHQKAIQLSICQKELRRLLAWQVGSEDGWQQSLGKNDKYLLQKLTPELGAKLLRCQDFSSPKALWQSLLATQELFHQVAMRFAHSQQFYYDKKTAVKVQSYTQRWYNDFYQRS